MKKFEDFRATRWVRKINRVVQVTLGVTLWVALNYIAAVYFFRVDITENHRYSLSQETLEYLARIEDKVDIYVSSPTDQPNPEVKGIYDDINNLLREYTYAGRINGEKKIEVHAINIFRDQAEAQMLVDKFRVDPTKEYVIVVACGDNYREIPKTELYEDGNSGKFRGEQIFTSSILNNFTTGQEKGELAYRSW